MQTRFSALNLCDRYTLTQTYVQPDFWKACDMINVCTYGYFHILST